MQYTLSRTCRIIVSDAPPPAAGSGAGNNHAGWPTPAGLGAWYEIDVELEAEPDAESGYIIGIHVIDKAIREAAREPLREALFGPQDRGVGLARLIRTIKDRVGETLGRRPTTLRFKLSPRHMITWTSASNLDKGDHMTTATDTLLVTEHFEFAASHRLHCPERSEEWNRNEFGKCNNPHGHGHNYKVEVTVRTEMTPEGTAAMDFSQLEDVVESAIIGRFDHRYLNEECPEFEDMNPSVENITRTCRDLLVQELEGTRGSLEWITVWETAKTSCTCRG